MSRCITILRYAQVCVCTGCVAVAKKSPKRRACIPQIMYARLLLCIQLSMYSSVHPKSPDRQTARLSSTAYLSISQTVAFVAPVAPVALFAFVTLFLHLPSIIRPSIHPSFKKKSLLPAYVPRQAKVVTTYPYLLYLHTFPTSINFQYLPRYLKQITIYPPVQPVPNSYYCYYFIFIQHARFFPNNPHTFSLRILPELCHSSPIRIHYPVYPS